MVWEEGDDGDGSGDINGREVNADGSAYRSILSLCTENYAQQRPAVVYDSDGQQYLVVWEDKRDGNDFDIYAAWVVPDDDDPTISRYVIAEDGTNERYPRVATNPADADYRFLVVWEQRDDTNDPIYGRFAAETGGTTGNAFQIMLGAVMPAVAYEGSLARYLVTARANAGLGLNHYGQLLKANGDADGLAFQVSHVGSADEMAADIAAFDGRFRVLWRRGTEMLGRDVVSAATRSPGYTVFGKYPGTGTYPYLACRDTLHCLAVRWISGDDIYVGLVFH